MESNVPRYTEEYFDMLMSNMMEFEGLRYSSESDFHRAIEVHPIIKEEEICVEVVSLYEHELDSDSQDRNLLEFGVSNVPQQETMESDLPELEDRIDLPVKIKSENLENSKSTNNNSVLLDPSINGLIQNKCITSLCPADSGSTSTVEYDHLSVAKNTVLPESQQCGSNADSALPANDFSALELKMRKKNHVPSLSIITQSIPKNKQTLRKLGEQVSKTRPSPFIPRRQRSLLVGFPKNPFSRSPLLPQRTIPEMPSTSNERSNVFILNHSFNMQPCKLNPPKITDNRVSMTLGELEAMYQKDSVLTFESVGHNNASYKCEFCLSQFHINSAYMTHLARNVTAMTFECWVCRKTLQFFNYCGLKAHIKAHERSGKIIRKNICVKVNKIAPDFSSAESITKKKEICPECSIHCDSIKSHLSDIRKPIDWELECRVCLYVAPSMCSLKMHMRTHVKKCPHSCPDCGHVSPTANSLDIHLNSVCFHFKKSIKCYCSLCGVLFNNQKIFRPHIVNTHNTLLYRCAECSFSCSTLKEVNAHANINHPNRLKKNNPLFHLCQYCPGLLISRGKYPSHVTAHLKDISSVLYVYTCEKCQLVTTNYSQFLDHVFSPICKDFSSLGHQAASTLPRYSGGKLLNPEEETTVIGKEDFTTNKEVNHSDLHSDCDKILMAHRNDLGSGSIDSCIKKKNRGTETKLGCDKVENSDKVKLSTYSDPNQLKCRGCDFKTDSLNSLRNHIPFHRRDPNLFQCLECGECFVVQSSLEKHLIVIHNIINTKEYINNNNVCNRLNEKKQPLLVHQCSVCQDVFNSQSELHKHFRSHGMAFLSQMKLI